MLFRSIEITDKEYPRKLEPVSPMKVLAGLKLNGINPSNAPARAVTSMILIKGDPFKAKIISKETQEIIDIPEDKPSRPSIKLIAFIIAIIHTTVTINDNVSFVITPPKPERSILSILIPLYVTILAARTCPNNLTDAGIPFKSSAKQNMLRTKAPIKKPIIFTK